MGLASASYFTPGEQGEKLAYLYDIDPSSLYNRLCDSTLPKAENPYYEFIEICEENLMFACKYFLVTTCPGSLVIKPATGKTN